MRAADAPAVLQADPVWSLEVTGEPRVLELADGRALTTFASGSVVMAYDSLGMAVDSFGRYGAGPGEFRLAGALAQLDGGRIGVIDPVLRRLTILSEALQLLATVDVPTSHEATSVHALRDGAWVSQYPGGGTPDSAQLRHSPASGGASRTIAIVHTPTPRFIEFGDVGFNLVSEYAARDLWGVHANGEIWIARGGDNRVDVVRPGGGVSIGEARPYPEIRTTPSDLERWRGQPAPENLRAAGDRRPMARTKAPFQGVTASPSGELWFWLNQPHGYATERYACRTKAGKDGATAHVPYGSKLIHVGHRHWYFFFLSAEGEAELRAYPRVSCDPSSPARSAPGR